MPKLKAPLFSIHARGTVANSLTYRHRKHLDVVSTVPTHLDANTPAQRRHRFLYRLGIALWNGMAAAVRAEYIAGAVGLPFTPMNLWLSEWLSTYPYLILALPIEQGSGPTVYDSSPTLQPATLYGPAWVQHNSHQALLTDGLDDYARLGATGDFDLNFSPWTVIYQATYHSTGAWQQILSTYTAPTGHWLLYTDPNQAMFITTHDGIDATSTDSPDASVILDQLAVWGFSLNVPSAAIFKNGQDITQNVGTMVIPGAAANPATLFRRADTPTSHANVTLNWLAIFSRILTEAEHLAITQMFAPELL